MPTAQPSRGDLGAQSFIHAATRFPAKRPANRSPVVPMGKYEIMYHSSATSCAMAARRVSIVWCNCAQSVDSNRSRQESHEARDEHFQRTTSLRRMRPEDVDGIAAGRLQGCEWRRITYPDGKVQGQSYRPKVDGRKGQALGRKKVLHCPKHVSQALRMRRARHDPADSVRNS
jgi:hypothetical protein